MASTATTLIFRGRLGQNPELRHTKDGKAVTNLSLAVDQGYGDNKRTEWIRVTLWDKQASAACDYLQRGDLVEIHTSSFRINAYATQDGIIRGQLEVTARRVDYIITKRNPNEAPATNYEDETIPF